jgi:hypothetical protein
MSLLNYQVHYNPTSHKDVLSKIRTFALARGWTSDKYVTSKDWLWDSGNSKYDWLAGTTDFLQLYSNGYGTHELTFRFHWQGDGSDAQAEWGYLTGIKVGSRTPNDQSSIKPYIQDTYCGAYGYSDSFPSGAHVALWLFGNSKFIMVVDQVSSDTVLQFYFGTAELFQQAMSTFGFTRMAQWVVTPHHHWYTMKDYQTNFISPWDGGWNINPGGGYRQFWWDGDECSADRVRMNFKFTSADGLTAQAFNSLGRAVRANTFTGKRVLIKPTIFGKRRSDDVWMPIGTFPFYRIECSGLQIGEKVTYGTEEYLVFPNTFAGKKYGTAYRIA